MKKMLFCVIFNNNNDCKRLKCYLANKYIKPSGFIPIFFNNFNDPNDRKNAMLSYKFSF